jgi:predicted Zn-dependent protease
MPAWSWLVLIALALVVTPAAAPGQTPVESARALVARYHEDPAAIDRAREVDATLALDPQNLRALALSGNVFLEVPDLFGGDREKAEQQFRKALELDPRFTVARVDLARVLIATRRYADARRELQRVIDEPTPNSVPDWTVKDLPRARELLESIKGK